MSHNPKYRRPLNNDQAEVLYLLYRFRFGTSDLIAQCFGKNSGIYVYKRLKILSEQGYIGQRYDKSYRIRGKPAAYYLLPDGLKQLNERRSAEGKDALRASWLYKESKVSEAFVQYCLGVFGIYCGLRVHYGNNLQFFTKNQLANRYEYFADFTPAVYIRLSKNGSEQDFFLEYLESDKPLFTILQRLKQYVEYAECGDWEDGTGADFPVVLLVCDTERLQKLLIKRPGIALDEDDLKFYVTTPSRLDTWQNLADQDEEPRSLQSI